MLIDCISDLHGHYPKLEGGDLLIVAGDLTARDTAEQHIEFQIWLHDQAYKKKIVIAGNHDNRLYELPYEGIKRQYEQMGESFLCDSGTEFEYSIPVRDLFDPNDRSLIYKRKLKIWGSPWTKTFPGMNPRCKAFTVDTEEELAERWALIPDDVDILVTHSPPYKVADTNVYGENCGSASLYQRLIKIRPRIHIFGHIHECGYKYFEIKYPLGIEQPAEEMISVRYDITHCVNASHVNECYEPVNKPIRIEL